MTAADPRTLMWTTACEMIDRAERLHRRFFQPIAAPLPELSWEPPIDITETDSEMLITVALPGVDRDAMKVTVDADGVSIFAFRAAAAFIVSKSPTANSDGGYAFQRRGSSSTNRNLPMAA